MSCSIADIAKKAGVSTTTVSRVINGITRGVSPGTRERVLHVIYEMNYRPNLAARGIARSRSGIIGVIIPDIANLFYPQVLRSIDDTIASRGYSMMLCGSGADPEREKQQLMAMVDNRVEGVILCSGVSNEAFLKEYRAYRMPLVMIGRSFDMKYADGCVSGDNEGGMTRSVSYLIGHGHRDILYLDGSSSVAGPMQRLKGYSRALEEHGIPPRPELIRQGEFSIAYGFDTVKRLMEEQVTFTAVAAGSDLIAIGAVKALKLKGRLIPRDVEVTGFDDIDLSRIYEPNISTVSKPHARMAQTAAQMLLDIIEGKPPANTRVTAEAELVLRDTTRTHEGDEMT